MIEVTSAPAPSNGWSTQASIRNLTIGFKTTDDALETRGSYLEYIQNKRDPNKLTKTAKNSIEDAAYQVALAPQSILLEEELHCNTLRDHAIKQQGEAQLLPYKRQFFLPVIVTTARLFICNFDPADIVIARGELPLDKAQINQYPYLLYRYALPRSLQLAPSDLANTLLNDGLDIFRRMDILVVNSAAISTMLTAFAERMPALALG
jgi:hypothetical protein